MNRLKTFTEGSGPQQTYVYDRFGNRALLAGSGNYMPNSPPTPQVTANDPTQVAGIFTNNRWSTAAADAAGNLTQPVTTGVLQLTYDAENRIAAANSGTVTTVSGNRRQEQAIGDRNTMHPFLRADFGR